MKKPTDVSLDEYVTDRFFCSGGSSGYKDAISCKGLELCTRWRTACTVEALTCLPLCLHRWLRVSNIIILKNKAKISGRRPAGEPFCRSRLPGGSSELGHHWRVRPIQPRLGTWKVQQWKSSPQRSRLPHRPVPDNAMAETAPGRGDPVPAWCELNLRGRNTALFFVVQNTHICEMFLSSSMCWQLNAGNQRESQ